MRHLFVLCGLGCAMGAQATITLNSESVYLHVDYHAVTYATTYSVTLNSPPNPLSDVHNDTLPTGVSVWTHAQGLSVGTLANPNDLQVTMQMIGYATYNGTAVTGAGLMNITTDVTFTTDTPLMITSNSVSGMQTMASILDYKLDGMSWWSGWGTSVSAGTHTIHGELLTNLTQTLPSTNFADDLTGTFRFQTVPEPGPVVALSLGAYLTLRKRRRSPR